ncbi:MAG: serine/threonine protein kinase [Candidatus Cryptobacteroides sp.]
MNTSCVSGFFEENDCSLTPQGELELLSRSQNGVFILYRCQSEGRYYVLKALQPDYRGQQVYEEMLRKEYEIGAALKHPNIREYYDLFEHPLLGNCIRMEWVDGSPLAADAVLPKSVRRRLLSQLLDAVAYMHLHQVIHRDLKPDNILVTRNGQNVKLIDFSLADSDSYSILKASAGTPLYASPEQLEGRKGDCRSDIYSLGVILSEFAENKRQRAVVAKCLRARSEQRYGCVEELRKAYFPSVKNRLLLMLAVLVLILSGVGFILTSRLQEAQSIYQSETIDSIFQQATEMLEEAGESSY